MALAEVIPAATLIVAAATVTRTIWEAARGLLAKRKARKVIALQAASNEQLRNVVQQFGERRPADAEIEAAAKTIGESLKGQLSEPQLRRISQGLNQSNKSGERRYIEDLISAVSAPPQQS